jgi:hypothetical protein
LYSYPYPNTIHPYIRGIILFIDNLLNIGQWNLVTILILKLTLTTI